MNYCDFLRLVHLLMLRAVQAVAGSGSACQDTDWCMHQWVEQVLALLLVCAFSLGHGTHSCFSFTLQQMGRHLFLLVFCWMLPLPGHGSTDL